MLIKKCTLFLGLIFISGYAHAEIPMGLKQVGSGEVHYLRFIKVYDAQLYTSEKATRNNILGSQTSRCLKLDYSVDLGVDKIVLASNTVLQRQNEAKKLQGIKADLDRLNASYRNVKKGDSYTLCYDGQSAKTTLMLNGKHLTSIPSSANFARIYMGMWLAGKNPISTVLRKKMLSGLR